MQAHNACSVASTSSAPGNRDYRDDNCELIKVPVSRSISRPDLILSEPPGFNHRAANTLAIHCPRCVASPAIDSVRTSKTSVARARRSKRCLCGCNETVKASEACGPDDASVSKQSIRQTQDMFFKLSCLSIIQRACGAANV
jgi:hypothetical protein